MVGLLFCAEVVGQGKIIINEYFIADNNANCPQYIELKNLGPGRQNIGCYIIANEKYSITIPANTFLNPGDIYLIAGVTTISNCGQTANKTVDLNWTLPGAFTSAPLTTSTSFFGNQTGNDSYPLVLYNTTPTSIDAVRSQGTSLVATQSITTSAAGTCGSKSLSAITLDASYNFEEIGSKPGTNSSNSRSIDGGCSWDKTAAKQTPGYSNVGLGGSYSLAVTESNTL